MVYLQFFNGHKHLLHLVCLGLSRMILNINAGVSRPGSSVDAVTAAALTCFPKIKVTYPAQIREPDILRIALYLFKDIINVSHINIVSILISLSRAVLMIKDVLGDWG
jgi:hypothetical protein